MNARTIPDAEARRRALDPDASSIVQAPAGSGKTGLLIQRYLALLARVDRPEEIVAITFTRKASAEMRRRVLQALDRAADGAPIADDNERLTRELALAALARDAERGWAVRANAARLRIQTIDALCTALARQMPVLAGIGSPPAIVEDASDLYREAAERTLATLENEDPAAPSVQPVLRHLDGDWALARSLLETMLRRRDQWLPRIAGVTADASVRAVLEGAFQAERARIIAQALAVLPAHEVAELLHLARYAAANLPALGCLADIGELPDEGHAGAEAWAALMRLLLTDQDEFRKTVNVRQGFPPNGHPDAKDLKARMEKMLARLCAVDGLCDALHAVKDMPPACFTDAQWAILGAMVRLLPKAASQLQVVFGERGQIDFTGLARAAVQALGEPDAPTDLLLALDVRIRHLLVDEFQDTSASQWQLLERLTAGWMPGDGRTVFVVGDPMQSIYRFREADVAVFLRAREAGLPNVPLADLRLETNFRSQQRIVDWVNEAFSRILPAREDREAGAVPYAPSTAFHPPEEGTAVQWDAFVGTDAERARWLEAARVVEICRAALAERRGSVAILVRNRSHLDRIVPALKRAAIPYRAIDIEPLGRRPVVQDLLAITRALAHPADRIAWLALLRAPWCALGVADLLQLCGGGTAREGARTTVWELLHDEARLAALSPAGREAARRTREALRPFVEGRLRGSLRSRVESAWLGLAGPAAAERASDLDDAETFFDQLDAVSDAGDIADAAVLEEKLARLYASAEGEPGECVQLLTIHRAKGLEFGTVIVPGLDRIPRGGDRGLFAWKARGDGRLLMAPIRATGDDKEPAHEFLRRLDATAEEHELERLLYVAATRAVRRLHLLGYARQGENGLRTPPSRTLLGKAWPMAKAAFEAATPMPEREEGANAKAGWDDLRALDAALFEIDVPPVDARVVPRAVEEPPRIEFSWVGETSREIGTVTHRWLQRIGMEGVEAWPPARIAGLAPSVRAALARRGVPAGELDDATRRVTQALHETLQDPQGRWILAAHPESRFEYRLRVVRPDRVRLIAIDRLFTTAGGERWVVDYKTSVHEGGDLETFLASEVERYREQLAGYASALGGKVRLGLYFPLLRAWREVTLDNADAPETALS